jgi:hypothetical protein
MAEGKGKPSHPDELELEFVRTPEMEKLEKEMASQGKLAFF